MKKHPIIRFVGLFIRNIDENPHVQRRIHTIGFWYWTINFPLITYLFFFQPDAWLQYGLFITLIYSIYANWTSDYTGMSASQGLMQAKSNYDKIDDVQDDLEDVSDDVDTLTADPHTLSFERNRNAIDNSSEVL